ncbi:MAG TPA: PAS domain S-box protein, partial [Tepidisphaeraceae bacterium]|nr:PAS domain S-box protein [Tepidisphaeraceae bacterium]
MAGKYERLSKVELAKRLTAMEEALRAQMDVQEILQDLHIHQEEVRVQNEQLIDMKRSLEQSRDRFVDLYDFAPIAYITLDANGVVLDINLTGTTLLAQERSRIIGTPFYFYVEEADRPAFLVHMRRCREEGSGPHGVISEIRLVAHDARKFIAQLMSRPASVEGGNGPVSFRTAVTDMTEWKRTEEEKRELAMKEQNARAAAEAKDRFMAILSHELRTPL